MKKQAWIVALALPAVAGIMFSKQASQVKGAVAEARPAPMVRAVEVAFAEPVGRIELTGLVRAEKRSKLAFVVAGRLDKRPAGIGDVVRKGQALAQIDMSGYRNQVGAARAAQRQAQAQRDQLARDVARADKLVNAKALGIKELERVQSGLDGATAGLSLCAIQLAEAKRELRESTLRAPFDGVVSEVFAEPGEFVAPGAPILALSNTTDLEIEVEVPESIIAALRKASEVRVSFPLADIPAATGVIKSVGEVASSQGRLFPVLVSLPTRDDLLAGMTAKVELTIKRPPQLAVPVEAVLDPSGTSPFVFRVRDSVLERVYVTPVDIENDRVLVDSELLETDLVVVEGHIHLDDGQGVVIAP